MLYSIRESEAEGNISTDSYTANKSLNQDTIFTKKSSSKSLPKRQKDLDEEIQNLNNVITQLRKVEQLLLNQVKDLKNQLEIKYKSSNTDQECIDELNKELNQLSNKLHHEIMHNSQQQKTNIELQKTILKLEQDLITSNQKNQDISEELQIIKSKYSHEHKFVESLLHMVISCHPENSFREQPSLKQAWKWLKSILSDYLQLKQKTRNYQEGSSQSSSSTNK
ncbi:unnamed protein product (macronuclear) [Paramecium tetraurelia]|uniref:GRIP domain-containing protein n=1 Tax=Paramecium tetraurelia TaxID=5888 RepID=A0CYV1_PARTE|nr:uncharacterized protein GSPATT00011569001 [Paramecium tetraurelia]CAK75968.1 unnamed protein product [Paramecium tetraurelia]|eukprot:XP_001443365.1 hypothetical protein (macronuclear) [Paramecium tetraurelia strain d4-2]